MKMQQQHHLSRTKIQDLFTHQTDPRLSYFYTSNHIIATPTAVHHFFENFHQYQIQQQENILNSIIRALKSVSTNAYLLNQHQSQQPMKIIKLLINLITQNVKNYLLFNLLLQIFQLLLPSSSLSQSLMKSATSRISQNFYEEKIDIDHLFGTINIAKTLYTCKIEADKEPKNMLIFHGNKGLQLLSNDKKHQLGWKFQQGMTIMFWIYIQNIKVGAQNILPKLFTFYSPNKGGVQSYMIDNKIFYRILGSKYTEPQIGSNGINLGEIQPKKWHFICFQHEGSKVFMKSKLNFYINKNKMSTFSIDPPKITKNQQTKFIFFDNFYGKTSSLAIFSHPLGSQQVQEYNKNINSMQNAKKTKAYLFQLHQGKLYQRNGFAYSPTYILERVLGMNFNNIFPFFYILKFINESNTYPILNELLGIVVLFFRKSSKNQNMANSEQYFKIISTLINRANQKIYDQSSIKSILHIKHTITDNQLLDQYFSDFLWSIIGANAEMERKQQIVEIIKNSFMQNVGHYRDIIGFDQMLNYLIKLQPKSVSCCQKHHNLVAKKIQNNFHFQSYSKAYRTTINYILQLIQLYFQCPNINFGQECYKLCRLLTLKFSPCFILDLISLIKKIITQKLNEKISESQSKKIVKYFQQKKIYLIFIHVIQNNFFAEIKAEAIKLIYQVLLSKKTQQRDELQVSLSISKSLWKINQEKNSAVSSPVKGNASRQIQSDEEQLLQTEQIQKPQKNPFQNRNKKFGNIDIQEDQPDIQYKQVGPVVPLLRNKDKGGKSFDFNFVNATSKPDRSFKSIPKIQEKERIQQKQVIEQEKTIDPLSDNQQIPIQLNQIPKKKGKKTFGLSINTQQINEMYNFGGQKGQQLIVSEQQQLAQLQKIKTLAKICINAMRKGKGLPLLTEQSNQNKIQKDVPKMMLPPPTMKNKTLQQKKKKILNLNFINEADEEEQPYIQENKQQIITEPVESFKMKNKKKLSIGQHFETIKQETPTSQKNIQSVLNFSNKKYSFTKSPSNISPSSNKSSSSSQDTLLSLYSSLLQCLLNMSFQTSLIQNSIIQIPSVLCIFFKWIPQTDLQTKFLNDLDIITEQSQNIQMMIKIPQLYDFLFQLCYKCILLEQMGQKIIYVQKLQNFVKKIFSHIFKEDPSGNTKLNYVIDWSLQKKDDYHPKSLFLATRYAVVLILQSFEEILLMNKTSSDKIRQRNFQLMGSLLEAMLKYIPAPSPQEFKLDQSERIILANDVEIISSLTPYFRSLWIDQTACRKYYYLFKKFFSTQWYNKGLAKFEKNQTNFVEIGINQLQRQSSYFLKENYLVSVVQIIRALMVSQDKNSAAYNDLGTELIWQVVVLIILSQTNKQKAIKNHRSERILSFLKNCKFLAQQQFQKVTSIIPILSTTKHFLGIMKMNLKEEKTSISAIGDGVLDQIISNYIPEQLLKIDKDYDIQSFRLHFSDVWIPSQNHYKKLHSEMFLKERQRNKKIEQKSIVFIETISNIIEEENQRHFYLQVLVQADRRKSMNKFRKIWDSLRMYSEIWKIPGIKFQVDTLFNKSIYSHEKYEASPYYKYKISKHQSKAKARYFLKLRLNENTFSQKELKEENAHQKNQIYLSKALIYSTEHLSIGKSKLNWLCDKQSFKHFDLVMPFKKIRLINTLTIRNGHLAIINDKLIFTASFINQKVNHLAIKQYHLRKDKSYFKIWPLQYIKDVLRRRYVNRKRAIQITFIHGKSCLLQFLQQTDLEDFFKKLTRLKGSKCPNLLNISKTTDAKKILESYGYSTKWNNFQMSNFEYLMQINNIAGRSYADTTQYPVMPWIVINFTGQKFIISDQNNYRNLELPMGALGSPERAANFEQRYHMLTVDDKKDRKFHYGTHYSSPGIIYHFLIRLYPFTQGAILLQSGKFDFADRLFFSIGDSYKNATTQFSDVRQLLPELYTLPEVYLNINGQDFGLMQNKKRVNNVQLPQWARDNPYLFVTKLRKAFQQKKVNQNVNKWIDLIFGYKQRGQQAINNLNCFFYLTYEDTVDWQAIEDEKQVHAIESQIMNFGQTPSQVFVKPHPERNQLSSIKNYYSVCDPAAKVKVYRPSAKKNLLQEEVKFNPFYQPELSIIHMKWVKDDKFVFIRRNGDVLFYKLHPPINTTNAKVPFQCVIQKQRKIQKMLKNEHQTHFVFDPSLEVTSFPIQFINKGNTICLGGLLDGKLILIDSETQGVIESYSLHEHTISCMRVDNKDNFLITGDVKGNVIVWKLVTTNNAIKLSFYESFNDQKQQITSIFFSYELKGFAVASMDGSVFVYNIISSKKIRAYYHPYGLPINQVVISTNPLAAIVLFSNEEGLMYSYSLNGQLIQRMHDKQTQCFMSPTLMRDSLGFEYVSYGNQKGMAVIRHMPYLDNPVMHQVAQKTVIVNRVCLSKSGKFFVTGASDGQLTVSADPRTFNNK